MLGFLSGCGGRVGWGWNVTPGARRHESGSGKPQSDARRRDCGMMTLHNHESGLIWQDAPIDMPLKRIVR
jgi:hypothetical protein